MRHPNADLQALAELADVKAAQLQTVIRMLVDAQLLSDSSKPAGVTAIDPRLAIETHIARAERQLAERSAEIIDLRTRVAEFVEDYDVGRAAHSDQPLVEVVVDLDDVRRRVYLASESVAHTQRSLLRSPSPEGLREGRHVDRDQQARGVEQRTIIATSELADPEVFEHLQDQHARGERVRALGNVPTQLLIMDESLAILAVDLENPRKGAIFVQEPGLLQLLIYLFDHLWSEADPVFNTSIDPDAPVGRPARILELVAGGVKDERIARTLGVATRTVRRDIADLRHQLNVTSRAEIVAAAVRRGWLQ
jgi:DNA-binding CsgD family transcriptional regulator/sugar-specific transcriptional regulator TrmB